MPLRLSRAMTYKAALAELPCGGGKAVILDHPGLKRAEAFEAYGRLVGSLRVRFYTGTDVGVTPEDLAAVGRGTSYVACESTPELGDINEHTARGVWYGMRACLEAAGLKRVRVALQGVGAVGMWLGRILRREGMELTVADLNQGRARQAELELGARVVAPEEILFVECDVLAPCALGGVDPTENPRARGVRVGQQRPGLARSGGRACAARHPLCARLSGERGRVDSRGGVRPTEARRQQREHSAHLRAYAEGVDTGAGTRRQHRAGGRRVS